MPCVVAAPTVMAGSGSGSGPDVAPGFDDVAAQLDKIEKATDQLEKLSVDDVAKLTGAAKIATGSGSARSNG